MFGKSLNQKATVIEQDETQGDLIGLIQVNKSILQEIIA